MSNYVHGDHLHERIKLQQYIKRYWQWLTRQRSSEYWADITDIYNALSDHERDALALAWGCRRDAFYDFIKGCDER